MVRNFTMRIEIKLEVNMEDFEKNDDILSLIRDDKAIFKKVVMDCTDDETGNVVMDSVDITEEITNFVNEVICKFCERKKRLLQLERLWCI